MDGIAEESRETQPGLEESALLLALSEAISSSLELRPVLQTVTDISTRLSGAQFGAFFYNGRDERGALYRLHVLSGADADAFAALPAPRITALFEPTFSGRETVRLADVAADAEPRPVPLGHLPVRSYLATPVVGRDGEVIGSLLFGHPEPGVFDARSERLVRIVAGHAAVAVENARLFEAEQAARRQAEATTQRLRLLHEVMARLAPALTVRDAIDAVMATAAQHLGASRAGVYLDDGAGVLRVTEGSRGDPGDPGRDWPDVPCDSTTPAGEAVVTRRPVHLATADEVAARFPAAAAMPAATDVGAVLCLPLTSGEEVQGALVLTWEHPRDLESGDVDLASATAVQLAQSLERARLYEAERNARTELSRSLAALTAVSSTLQRSLLPRRVPTAPQVDVAVRYRPGTAEAEVGGDWYDVVPTPRGTTVFVVGDVQGHNLAAAAVMGQLRTGLNAYLSEGHEPDVAVGRSNRLLATFDPSVLVTCCLAELDPSTGALRVVRAGHPLPLLRSQDGRARELDVAGGLPLGVDLEATWPVTLLTLTAGDRLVLYTDGLVERPDLGVDDGLAALVAAAQRPDARDVETAADALLDAVGPAPADDVALLVLDFAGPMAGQLVAALDLAPDPRAVAEARRFTGTVLQEWGLGDLGDVAALLVSEMTTNALVHAGGSASLELRVEDDRLRLSVADSNPHEPRPRQAEVSATNGRGLMLVEALSSAWGVEPNVPGKVVWADVPFDGLRARD